MPAPAPIVVPVRRATGAPPVVVFRVVAGRIIPVEVRADWATPTAAVFVDKA